MAKPKDMKFDKRIARRSIDSGVISKSDWETRIKDLPDVSDNMEVLSIDDDEEDEVAEGDSAPADADVAAEADAPVPAIEA